MTGVGNGVNTGGGNESDRKVGTHGGDACIAITRTWQCWGIRGKSRADDGREGSGEPELVGHTQGKMVGLTSSWD